MSGQKIRLLNDFAVAGAHDDRDLFANRFDFANQFLATNVRHDVVSDDDIKTVRILSKQFQSF